MTETVNTPSELSVEGTQYLLIKERLKGGRVYHSEDNARFLRIGEPVETRQEHIHTIALKNRGYPVPEVIGSGELGEDYYFVENSLGDKHFGEIFIDETVHKGKISEESFSLFRAVTSKYFDAQCRPENHLHQGEPLAIIANLPRLLISYDDLDETKIKAALDKAENALAVLPRTYLQTDYNAFNVMPGGVIDLEYLHAGPVGYDVVSGIYFADWWPRVAGFDYQQVYRFTPEQINNYLTSLDTIADKYKLPQVSAYTEHYLMIKTMWAACKGSASLRDASRHAKFWQWRREALDRCLAAYLTEQPILETVDFEDIDKTVLARNA